MHRGVLSGGWRQELRLPRTWPASLGQRWDGSEGCGWLASLAGSVAGLCRLTAMLCPPSLTHSSPFQSSLVTPSQSYSRKLTHPVSLPHPLHPPPHTHTLPLPQILLIVPPTLPNPRIQLHPTGSTAGVQGLGGRREGHVLRGTAYNITPRSPIPQCKSPATPSL